MTFGSFARRSLMLTSEEAPIVYDTLESTILTSGQANISSIPSPQTAPISAPVGALLEIVIFGLAGDMPITISPGAIDGVTWIEIGFNAASNESGGVWAGIVTEAIVEIPIPITHSGPDRVAWYVSTYQGYAEGAGGANAYLQGGPGVFARPSTARTMSALSAEGNMYRASIASFGPDTISISIASDHTEVDRIEGIPGENLVQSILVEGTSNPITFNHTNPWFPGSTVAFEVVKGPAGPSGSGGPPINNDGIGIRFNSAIWMTSGHSLLDEPLNQYIALLASDVGAASDWQRQYEIGSAIQWRTMGTDTVAPYDWLGYSNGHNRSGANLNMIDHLRSVSAVNGKATANPYTHFIIGEGHDILIPLASLNTVKLLRHYYELVREGSPNAIGYFYSTWLDIEGVNLTDWITYARETDTAHAAICGRINASLDLEGRTDRLMLLPAAGALAELMEQATTGTVNGITQGTEAETIDIIFSDSVHLTDVGKYFLACVCYGAIYRRDPRGRAYPVAVTATQATSLQQIAWEVLQSTYGAAPYLGPQMTASEAQTAIVDYVSTFAGIYNTLYSPEPLYNVAEREAFFGGTSSHMYFDPDTDESFWLDPP